jgi:hypothetical protein
MRAAFLVAALAFTQSAGVQDFAGTWTATFKGEPLARLELTFSNAELRGQLSLNGMHVDAQGDVDGLIPDAGHTAPIFDVSLHEGVLTFAAKDEDDTDRFAARLVDGHVLLTFIPDTATLRELAANGIPVPRPITMTREGPRSR